MSIFQCILVTTNGSNFGFPDFMSKNCWIPELFKSPEYFLMNAVLDRYLNISFAIFLVNFDESYRSLADV